MSEFKEKIQAQCYACLRADANYLSFTCTNLWGANGQCKGIESTVHAIWHSQILTGTIVPHIVMNIAFYVVLSSNCNSGQFLAHTQSLSCQPCNSGQSCFNPAVTPIVCTSGQSCFNPAVAPIVCTSGQSCLNPAVTPIVCTPGQSCFNPAVAPIVCTSGQSCLNPAVTPIVCTPGQSCVDPRVAPVQCPAGSYCSDPSEAPKPCPKHNYCPAGSSEPTPCPQARQGDPKSLTLTTNAKAQGDCTDVTNTNSCPITGGLNGKTRDCGWSPTFDHKERVLTLCKPGAALNIKCTTAGGIQGILKDHMLRVCKGPTACLNNDVDRLGADDNSALLLSPLVTLSCNRILSSNIDTITTMTAPKSINGASTCTPTYQVCDKLPTVSCGNPLDYDDACYTTVGLKRNCGWTKKITQSIDCTGKTKLDIKCKDLGSLNNSLLKATGPMLRICKGAETCLNEDPYILGADGTTIGNLPHVSIFCSDLAGVTAITMMAGNLAGLSTTCEPVIQYS